MCTFPLSAVGCGYAKRRAPASAKADLCYGKGGYTEMKASFRSAIGSPSPEMEPVRVGRVPPGKGTPDVFVIAEENDKPVLRIDVCHLAPEQSAFAECIAWKHWIVVAMIDLKKKRQQLLSFLLRHSGSSRVGRIGQKCMNAGWRRRP